MDILKIIFILLTTFSTIHCNNNNNQDFVCPNSFCGDLSVDYPFKLLTTQPQNNCTYIHLTCNNNTDNGPTFVASLPFAGDFYVSALNYIDSYIELHDPENCLMGRLMKNFNLALSPFKAFFHENYTFYECPSESNVLYDFVLPIECLSNPAFATVATARLTSHFMLGHSCQVIGSWLLPVKALGQFESVGINSDLYLTWNSTTCIDCKEDQQTDNSVCALYIRKIMAWRNVAVSDSTTINELPESATATIATPPRPAGDGGPNEPKINSCTELNIVNAPITYR
ncbi:PREDICTED: putative RING-H2 finger protein ATL21A [Erythranthe guttata]|uniref:putative RING-H2 finger protein ATL21A n=1 Tax=Erythranthe guttata TaxID=4155 RepID=UPI00064E142A|nr:PREDICTED: putative RING-H2 finger protein ATL21A [Erythranthe guttata]|eukprot:XP_012835598.1 PREDICTED: putative RING-H2 finger protein ATL21A [Erythranthe guttata]